EEVILITDQLLESLSHPALNADTKDLIRTQITSLGDPEHRVREILLESLSHPALNAETKDLIRTQITSLGDPEHRVREIVLCAGGSRQIPVGLSALAEELTATSGTLLRYVMHNKAVFTSHYMDIVEEELSRRTD
ncbi:T-complex protein 11-like protein 1, partial [Operophtera brumata]